MKRDDIAVSRETDGGGSVFVMRINTKEKNRFSVWFLRFCAALWVPMLCVGVFEMVKVLRLSYRTGSIALTFLPMVIIVHLVVICFSVVGFCVIFFMLFGHKEIRIGSRSGETFVGIGRLGFRKRFAIGPDAYLTTRCWRDFRRNYRYDLILNSTCKEKVRLYCTSLSIGSRADTVLIRQILCEGTSLKDGRDGTRDRS